MLALTFIHFSLSKKNKTKQKSAHLSGQTLQTPPKFHEKTLKKTQKEQKWEREMEKNEILGPPPFRASPFGPNPPFGPTPGPHPPPKGVCSSVFFVHLVVV